MRIKNLLLLSLTVSLASSATLMPMARVRTIGRYAAAAIAKSYKKIGSNVATGAAIISSPVAKFMAKHPIVKGLARGAAIIVAAYAAAACLALGIIGTAYIITRHGPAIAGRARAVGRALINTPGRIKNFILSCPVRWQLYRRARQTGMQPIFVAAHNGIIPGLEILVTAANVNIQNPQGATLLAEATAQGHEGAVRWLLAHGADTTIADHAGHRASDKAHAGGFNHIEHILITHDIEIRARQTGIEPTFVAAHDGIIPGLEMLVTPENINTPNPQGATLLAEAAAQGHEEAVQWLLAHGANPAIANDRGDRAIDRAEASGHDGVVNILTRHALRAHAPEASPVIHEPEQEAPAANRPATDPTIECPICMSDTQDFVTLTCKHQYCCVCLRELLKVAIPTKNSATLRCPNCKTEFTMGDIEQFATRRQYTAIEEIKTTEALPELGINHCPTPGCTDLFPVDETQPARRRCGGCTRLYCIRCLTQHSERVSCQDAAAARNPSAAERATEEWKQTHTKKCPHCHKDIEKNEGCNHMTCRKESGGCGHQFCWICMQDWAPHGNNWYNCTDPLNVMRNTGQQNAPQQQQQQRPATQTTTIPTRQQRTANDDEQSIFFRRQQHH